MCSEEISGASRSQSHVEGHIILSHETACPLEHDERSVSLVQMADLRLITKRFQQSPTKDPEQNLLKQPRLGVATIELAGNLTMNRVIRWIVRVEEIELRSSHLGFPCAHPGFV